uniref:Uncharacterized protein n=1 Tax=Sphaerodactylus townsendi TaxID=933632 RepID=A0ACB8EY03_9SAUR
MPAQLSRDTPLPLKSSPASGHVLTYIDGKSKVDESYFKHRVGFLYPMPSSNISIAINNTQEDDSGQYMCTVNLGDESSTDGRNIGLVNLTVLVPPSSPTCKIQGTPHVGGNVTMSCKSSSGKPSPMYHWRRTNPTFQVFFSPMQDLSKGTLTLMNLTTDMSGTYICNASNLAGYSNCTITLEVNPAFNAAVVAGAVVGALIGLGLILLFALQMFVYRRKKKDVQEEIANEIKEDAVAPKTLSWAKSPGSDIVSKNGTLSSMSTTQDHKLYASKPPSDTASVTTTTGSMMGYKPPYTNPRGGTLTPTPSLSSQSLPLYFPPTVNGIHCHHANVPVHRNAQHRTNGAQPQEILSYKPPPRAHILYPDHMRPVRSMNCLPRAKQDPWCKDSMARVALLHSKQLYQSLKMLSQCLLACLPLELLRAFGCACPAESKCASNFTSGTWIRVPAMGFLQEALETSSVLLF